MPFPYLAPVKKWVVDVLKEREYSTNTVDITAPTTIPNNFNIPLYMLYRVHHMPYIRILEYHTPQNFAGE